VQVNTFDLRAAHNFVNKTKPYRNFRVWAGTKGITISNETVGEIN